MLVMLMSQVSGGQIVGCDGYMEDLRERAGSRNSFGERASLARWRPWGSGHLGHSN